MPGATDPMQAIPLLGRAIDFLDAGGPVVMILLACSVVALAVILMKLWQFHAVRLGARRRAPQALALLRAGRPEEALTLLAGSANPVARVLARAIHGRQRRDLPEAVVREEVLRSGNEAIEGLRSHLGVLEVIGAIAPLLGLFGTVLGMIEAFRRLAAAGSQVDPSILSGGIWEALLTTAVGLAVAIPVVVLCNWFERRVDRVAHDMDNLVTQVFTQDLAPERAGTLEPYHDSAGLRLASAE
ncbi:MAG: MotA/TolQ/ExbB proton channel family protein [Kiloniellaceae bacterium]